MSPIDPLDDYMDGFGRTLTAAAPVRREPLSGRRTAALAGVAVAAAAAGVVVSTTGGKLDVVAEAQAALAPDDAIINYRVIYGDPKSRNGERSARDEFCATSYSEIWRTTGAPVKWKYREPTDRCGVLIRGNKAITGPVITAFADGVLDTYSPDDSWLVRVKGVSGAAAKAPDPNFAPKIGESSFGDPIERIQSLLASGELVDAGTQKSSNGRVLKKLVGQSRASTVKGKQTVLTATSVTYLVDAKTYAPVLLRWSERRSLADTAKRLKSPPPYEIKFLRFQTLPKTAENEKLLEINPAHGVKVQTRAPDRTWLSQNSDKWTDVRDVVERAQKTVDRNMREGIRKIKERRAAEKKAAAEAQK